MTQVTYRPDLFPTLRFADAFAGIEWLERVLGFERHLIVPGEDGGVMHAELRLGRGFLMLGSDRDDIYGIRSPRATGGKSTHSIYIAAADTAERYARAQSAGATIERELHDTEYGSTEFGLRDPEGHLWSVGTYHPVAGVADGETETGLPPELYAAARYADARAAIAFFERAFGAGAEFVAPGGGEEIAHAQIRFGSSIFMLGSAAGHADTATSAALGGATTVGVCVAIDDVDALFARAVAAGATAITPPSDTDYGARMTTLRDLEGYVWTFGNYRPESGA